MTGEMRKVGNMSVKVIKGDNMDITGDLEISNSDAEMDRRAVAAVRAAIDKAQVCNKPVAKYDVETKRAFVEYADGSRQYVE